MKDEIKEILDSIQEHLKENEENFKKGAVDSTVYYLYCDNARTLLDYITNLQTIEQQYSAILSENAELQNKLDQYENPDDMTLFYMWLDTKAKDKIKQLQEENERLKEVVENLTTMTVCGDRKQIKNTAQFKLEQCQSRIDKATDYIEKCRYYHEGVHKQYEYVMYPDEIVELLNILQGDKGE